ncbi:MAG TPA: hypothetical protein VHH36_03260 [Candidatus Thermoplasmatota archaeon]|nr:hypothetical protein [Candidatus Thermoplasmatota archaeon]
MALRATSAPAPDRRSARSGERVEFRAKVENTGADAARVALFVEDLKEGALGKPVDFAFAFEPPAQEVPRKSRKGLAFAWTAATPPGRDAFTFRGRLVLRAADGAVVGEAPLDLYVDGQARS